MIIKEREKLSLDSHGRVYLSRGERAEFGAEILVAKTRNQFLFMTEEELNSILTRELNGLKGLDLRKKRRALLAGVFLQRIDRQGRVLIPSPLREVVSA